MGAVSMVGSIAIKGVFKAAGLLAGLGSTINKLKKTQMTSKSTTTEMKRMTNQTHLLRKALAMIGVAGFTNLLMQTPQLAGSLAKIKNELTQLAWSIGKHLKPSLDAVAEILRGIRTGDWSTVKKGISDLTTSLAELGGKTIKVILEPVIGEKKADKCKTDFENFIEDIKKAYEADGLWGVVGTVITEPFLWLIDNKGIIIDVLKSIGDAILTIGFGQNWKNLKNWAGNLSKNNFKTNLIDTGKGINDLFNKFYLVNPNPFLNKNLYKNMYENIYSKNKTEIPNETIMPSNIPSNVNSTSNITVDFSNANINLANGIEIDEFANIISRKIAENQTSRIY